MAEHDDLVARPFVRVTGMLDSPAYLFRPRAQTWSVGRRWRCLGLIETLGNRLPGCGVQEVTALRRLGEGSR